MNIDFERSFERTMGSEGGFQNKSSDRGNWTTGVVGRGELKGTKFGISAMSYPHLDIKNLTLEQAKGIYYEDWWLELRMDLFKPALAYQMFDAAMNHGMGNAVRMLQRAVQVLDDGRLGPKTLSAVGLVPIDDLAFRFLAQRIRFMTQISTWKDYGKGWMARVADNLEYAAEDTP